MLKCDKAAMTAGSVCSPCLGGTAVVGLLGAGLGGGVSGSFHLQQAVCIL